MKNKVVPAGTKFRGAIAKSGSYKVMIGIPMHKGEVCAVTMMSVSQAISQINRVNFHLLGLSLLAKNFNLLFIHAIQSQCDFFLLHHSDLGVQGCVANSHGSWLDLLVQRLLENKLAAISAIVPIKSPQGYTSSGLETVKNDPWSLRRLTIRECNTLPLECIDRDDVCNLFGVSGHTAGALLVNSGLLLMDIRNHGGVYSELKWPGFNIVDFIEWNKSGRPSSYTIPEDWNFSAWMHENKLPYACTRELIVHHSGGAAFMNVGEWGEERDCPRQQVHPDQYKQSQ